MEQLNTPNNLYHKRVKKSLSSSNYSNGKLKVLRTVFKVIKLQLNRLILYKLLYLKFIKLGLESLKEDEMSDFTASFNSHINSTPHTVSATSLDSKKKTSKLEKVLLFMCVGSADYAD